jgi:hypothetical protein
MLKRNSAARAVGVSMAGSAASQPRKTTTATDDKTGKIKAKMPARIIRLLRVPLYLFSHRLPYHLGGGLD